MKSERNDRTWSVVNWGKTAPIVSKKSFEGESDLGWHRHTTRFHMNKILTDMN